MLYVQKNSARHVHVTFWAASGFVNIIYVLFELWVCGLRLDHVLIWHGYLFGCEQSFSTELTKLWYLATLGLLLTLPLYAWSASSSISLLLACRFRDPPASCILLDPDWLSLRPDAVTWTGIIRPARFTGRRIAVALRGEVLALEEGEEERMACNFFTIAAISALEVVGAFIRFSMEVRIPRMESMRTLRRWGVTVETGWKLQHGS